MASLNERILEFLASLPNSEDLDSSEFLDFPGEKADFLLFGRKLVVEVKALEAEQEGKIENEMDFHRKRPEFPLFYGAVDLQKVLEHLPDGEKIARKIGNLVTRGIEANIRKANRQIKATTEALNIEKPVGLLVILNDRVSVLSPDVIARKTWDVISRKDSNGFAHYGAIQHVWILSENHMLVEKGGKKSYPSIMIDGLNSFSSSPVEDILSRLPYEWAKFNNSHVELRDVEDADQPLVFRSVRKLAEDEAREIPRSEAWRRQYRKNPYLRELSEREVLNRGVLLIKALEPVFLKNEPAPSGEVIYDLMEKWTHFLEEAKDRALDLRDIPKP